MALFSAFGLAVLAYLYGGYAFLLHLLAPLRRSAHGPETESVSTPMLTVLITVYNEANVIAERIDNVLACDYPDDRLEVLVASDGSSDDTDNIVNALMNPRIRLFRPDRRVGKTDTQNQAVSAANGDIIVFTDADTIFDRDFLHAIVKPFADPRVGGVDGHLLFAREGGPVGQSQSFYWRQELQIRVLESRLGWLSVASGACLAIRRSLFRPMAANVGEDCLLPLDVVGQGYRMVHAKDAVAYDRMPSEPEHEFRTRVRMTVRNWQGTWMYPRLLNPFRNPGIAFALWSHKVLRWLSPVFLGLWLIPGLVTLASPGLAGIPGWLGVAFMSAGAIGWLDRKRSLKLAPTGIAYGFFLANAGFAVGVARALAGRRITTYPNQSPS